MGHIASPGGDAKSVAEGISNFLERKNIASKDIQTVGCDGAAVNTGSVKGVVRLLENNFGRPLQWLVCLLHSKRITTPSPNAKT